MSNKNSSMSNIMPLSRSTSLSPPPQFDFGVHSLSSNIIKSSTPRLTESYFYNNMQKIVKNKNKKNINYNNSILTEVTQCMDISGNNSGPSPFDIINSNNNSMDFNNLDIPLNSTPYNSEDLITPQPVFDSLRNNRVIQPPPAPRRNKTQHKKCYNSEKMKDLSNELIFNSQSPSLSTQSPCVIDYNTKYIDDNDLFIQLSNLRISTEENSNNNNNKNKNEFEDDIKFDSPPKNPLKKTTFKTPYFKTNHNSINKSSPWQNETTGKMDVDMNNIDMNNNIDIKFDFTIDTQDDINMNDEDFYQ